MTAQKRMMAAAIRRLRLRCKDSFRRSFWILDFGFWIGFPNPSLDRKAAVTLRVLLNKPTNDTMRGSVYVPGTHPESKIQNTCHQFSS